MLSLCDLIGCGSNFMQFDWSAVIMQACAHRYTKRGIDSEIALGLCIVIMNPLDEGEYLEPCSGLPANRAHGEYGYCQAGTSLDISPVGQGHGNVCCYVGTCYNNRL